MNRLMVLACCLAVIPAFAWSLKCYHCDYGTVSQCHPDSGNLSSVISCTPSNTRCYKQKISKVDKEDKVNQGCTNEDSCGIRQKSCEASGDCTATCCDEDLCNNKARSISKRAQALVTLAIALTLDLMF